MTSSTRTARSVTSRARTTRATAASSPRPGRRSATTSTAPPAPAPTSATSARRPAQPGKGYYSFDVGSTWHVVVLNSNCDVVSCAAGSAQEQWLRADLAATSRPCVIATWHHPRFSSSYSNTPVAPFWNALQDYGAELTLAGPRAQLRALQSAAAVGRGQRERRAGDRGRHRWPQPRRVRVAAAQQRGPALDLRRAEAPARGTTRIRGSSSTRTARSRTAGPAPATSRRRRYEPVTAWVRPASQVTASGGRSSATRRS